MEYIIIGLLVILIILVLISLFKRKENDKDNLDMLERLSRFEVNVTKEIGNFKSDLLYIIIFTCSKYYKGVFYGKSNI